MPESLLEPEPLRTSGRGSSLETASAREVLSDDEVPDGEPSEDAPSAEVSGAA